jgi:hypothetical protein
MHPEHLIPFLDILHAGGSQQSGSIRWLWKIVISSVTYGKKHEHLEFGNQKSAKELRASEELIYQQQREVPHLPPHSMQSPARFPSQLEKIFFSPAVGRNVGAKKQTTERKNQKEAEL